MYGERGKSRSESDAFTGTISLQNAAGSIESCVKIIRQARKIIVRHEAGAVTKAKGVESWIIVVLHPRAESCAESEIACHAMS
jgi:hypothetical protein